ncbi:cytochrome P450 [Camillea tinctor]|nr:cytochrome P450 [Camillea tinctor]
MTLLDDSFDPRITGTFLLLLGGWLSWLLFEHVKFSRKYKFPPLVPGLPVLGNTFQIPSIDQGPYLQKLGQKYGEIFTLKFGRSYWVILNSRRVAQELLEKRAAIYSSRQKLPMAHDIVSGGKRMLLMPYGDQWRRQRRIMHQILNSSQRRTFEPFQDIESKALMYHLLTQSTPWYLCLGRFSNSVIMSVVFGRRTELNDPHLSAVYRAQEEFVPYLMPGSSIVDTFPLLANLPLLKRLQPWRRKGDDLYQRTLQVFSKLVDDLQESMHNGTHKSCFMSELLQSEKETFSKAEVAFMAGTLIEAGTDTTRTSMLELIAGTAMYPDWVPHAREELDAVCGANAERLPSFDDIDKFPMIKAAIKEAVRWRPTNSQTGIPHALTKDDEFEGYRLPAGTVVTWNNWGISHNPEDFDRPECFDPSRFLDENVDKIAKGHLGFGAGRRLCVGSDVAANNLFIAVSRLIYCFDVEQDPAHPIVVDKPFPLSAEAEPYKVIIKPRTDAHRELIFRECSEAA